MTDHTPAPDEFPAAISRTRTAPPGPYHSAMRRAAFDRLRPGDVLGGLVVIRFLAAGGMGEVYEAEQGGGLRRRVIIKVVRGHLTEVSHVRFVREGELQAGAGAGMHHQGILPVYAAGQDGDRVYLILPYVRGGCLRETLDAIRGAVTAGHTPDPHDLVEAIARQKDRDFSRPWLLFADAVPKVPMSPTVPPGRVELPLTYFRWVAERVVQAARALESAHTAGVLHLDVHPGNVLIAAGADAVRVADFGIGAQFDPATNEAVACEPLGVPWYMPPEKREQTADRRSDVFGLGAILSEFLTLQRPGVKGETNAPADLLAIAAKARSAEPDARYPTAAAFADDVQRWLDRRVPEVRWGVRQYPRALGLWVRRNRAWSLSGLFMILAVVGLLFTDAARARAEAAAKKTRDAMAHAEAERELDRQYEKSLSGALVPLYDQPRRAKWAEKVRENIAELARLRPGADLREMATATLDGFDVHIEYRENVSFAQKPADFPGPGQVAFSPDGKKVVAAAWWEPGRTLHPATLWDGNLATKLVPTTQAGRGPVAFPDADSPLQLIAGAEEDDALTLWNVGTHAAVLDIPLPRTSVVAGLGLSPDARFTVASLRDGLRREKTLLWAIDRKGGTAKKVGEWGGLWPTFAFSPDGALVACGSATGEVVIRATADAKEVFRFRESDLMVTALAFGRNYRRPNGDGLAERTALDAWQLAVGSHGGGLSAWDLRLKARANTFYGSRHGVYAAAFSPDGTVLASGGRAVPHLWDVATGRPLVRLEPDTVGFPDWVVGLAFSPDGGRLAIGSPAVMMGGSFLTLRLQDGRGVHSLRGLTGVVEKVWLSRSGKYVAAVAQNWQFGVWERETGRTVFVWNAPEGWTTDNASADFETDDSGVLFVAGKRASRWSLKTGERTGNWELPRGLDEAIAARTGQNPLLVRRDPGFDQKPFAIRGQELLPDGKLKELYTLPPEHGSNLAMLTPEGRLYSGDFVHREKGYEMRWFDGATGTRIPLPGEVGAVGRVTRSGRMVLVGVPRSEAFRVFALPEYKLVGEHPVGLCGVDDTGRVGVDVHANGTPDKAVALYRVGEPKPLIRFDARRLTPDHSVGISPDGRTVYWGRADGTVCLADVNTCLEQLAPFGPR